MNALVKKITLYLIQREDKTRLKILLGWLLTACFLLFFPGEKDSLPDVIIAPIFDLGHIPLFFTISWISFFCLPRTVKSTPLRYRYSFILCLFFIFATELIQPIFYRTFSFSDIINDLVGVLFSLSLIKFWDFQSLLHVSSSTHTSNKAIEHSKLRQTKALVLVTMIVPLSVAIYPIYQGVELILFQKSIFPTLSQFQNPHEKLIWQNNNLNSFLLKNFLFFETKNDEWSGVEFSNFVCGERFSWRNYKNLVIDITNLDNKISELNLRIDDDKDCKEFYDRFNRLITLQPGENSIVVSISEIENSPKNRRLDLENIKRILMFANSHKSLNLKLNNIKLE